MIRVLVSGGMDSAVCLAWSVFKFGPAVDAVFFSYGQRHRDQEYAAAVRLCRHFGISHWSLPLDLSGESSLTGEGELDGSAVVVPGRNEAFLRRAVATFPGPEAVVMGACADDHEVFPDCRPAFFDGMREALAPVQVLTPLVDLTKREVFEMAQVFGGTSLLSLSWSCYRGEDEPCGDCGACRARARAFTAPCGVCDECNAGILCRELPR